MLLLRNALIIFVPAGLTSCAIAPPVYYGLNASSYGTPTITTNSSTGQPRIRLCDGGYSDFVGSESGRVVAGSVIRLLNVNETVDETIKVERLTHHFKIPGDSLSPNAYVAAIERDSSHIVFWHDAHSVVLSETMAAATEFCGRVKKTTTYIGTATSCVSQSGYTFTRAISSYRCI